jgi:hypothetical protein
MGGRMNCILDMALASMHCLLRTFLKVHQRWRGILLRSRKGHGGDMWSGGEERSLALIVSYDFPSSKKS